MKKTLLNDIRFYLKKIPRPLLLSFRYIIGLSPIIWIFSKTDIAALISNLKQVPLWTMPVASAIVLLVIFFNGYKWWLLIRCFIIDLPLSKAMRTHLIGTFYSLVLPTSAAQDFVRASLLSKEGDYPVIWGSSWVSRIFGLMTYGLFSICSLYFIRKYYNLPSELSSIITITLLTIPVVFLLSFSKKTTKNFRGLIQKFLPRKILVVVENIRESIYQFRYKKVQLFTNFIITLLLTFFAVLNCSLILKGITGHFYFIECFAFIPLIEIITMSLPLTPNGIGVRESLTAVMFATIGISNESLAIYISISLLLNILKLVGGIPLLFRNGRG
jgi:uncharacterized protein (TIRG00374 family)